MKKDEFNRLFIAHNRAKKVLELYKNGYVFSEKELEVIFNIYWDMLALHDLLQSIVYLKDSLFDAFKENIYEIIESEVQRKKEEY